MCWNFVAPFQKVFTNQLRLVIGHHLVEDMVAPFIGKLECHSGLLQQICQSGLTVTTWPDCGLNAPPWALLTCLDISTGQFAGCAKMNSDEFTLLMKAGQIWRGQKEERSRLVDKKTFGTYKTGRVVIPHSFGITICFQEGVSSNDLILKGAL